MSYIRSTNNPMLLQYLLLFMCITAPAMCSQQRRQQQQQQQHPATAGIAPTAWQAEIICSTTPNITSNNKISGTEQLCSKHNKALVEEWKYLLRDSSAWPTVTTVSGTTRFQILAQYLKPLESNVRFAQAYCLNKGGQLAYWDSPQQYTDLAQLALSLAKDTKRVWHMLIGAVQLAGSREPHQGWIWVHNKSQVSSEFPWAKGEPNQHNGNKQGHVEDCAVLATYHGQTAKLLVDDFPCNYADSKGRYQNNGWNPHLSVACRLPAS